MKYTLYIALLLLSAACKTSADLSNDEGAKTKDDPPGVISQKDQKLRSYFLEAGAAQTRGDLDIALQLYEECLQIDPKEGAVHYELSKVHLQMSSLSKALDHALQAVESDGENRWYLLHVADIYQYTSQFELAADYYGQAVKLDNSPENLLAYVNALVNSNRFKDAVHALDEIEAQVGTNPEIINQKYQLYMMMGEKDQALNQMKGAVNKYPDDLAYKGMLAAAYEEQGDLDNSIKTYQEMLEMDPDNPRIHMALYRYYKFVGEDRNANKSLLKIFASDELHIDEKMKLLLDLYDETETDRSSMPEVYDLLDQLIEQHPEEAKAYSIYGDFLARDERQEEARDLFAEALKHDAEKFLVWNQVMYLDLQLSDYDALLKHSTDAIEVFPNQPGVYYYNGYALYKKGEYEEAIDMLESGKSFVIDNQALKKEFCQTLGDVYYKKKDLDNAFLSYDCVLKIEPNNAFILNNYAYYLALANQDLEKAETMANKAVSLFPSQASYLDTKAWILFRKKEYTKAHMAQQKALENGGNNNPVMLEHMGDILYFLDKVSEAVDYWKQSVNNGSESETVQEKINQQSYIE